MTALRGFTLLEVLAALVVVALLATAVVPIVRHAAQLLRSTDEVVSVEEVGRIADAIVAEPAGEASGAVRVRRLDVSGMGAPGAWFLIQLGPVAVSRFVRADELKEDER